MNNRYVEVEVAETKYGVDLAAVQEIVVAGPMTRIPHAPAAVRGLFNLRGKVIVVIDLASALGLSPTVANDHSVVLVLASPNGDAPTTGLLLDAVVDIVNVPPGKRRAAPASCATTNAAVAEVAEVGGALVLLLDVPELLSFQRSSPLP